MPNEASHENSHLTPLNFAFDSHAVRVILLDSEPWFVAADVCSVLGYANAPRTVGDMCRQAGIRKTYIRSGGQLREMLLIDEGNLYRLIIKSRKPQARAFESLVCDEILPTIRKTGRYAAPGGAVPLASSPTQVLAAQKTARDLMGDLKAETDPGLRRALYPQLVQCRQMLGLDTPPLDAIGRDAPAVPDEALRFWDAFRMLEGQGLRLNHSHDRALIAVNVPFVLARAAEHGVHLPRRTVHEALHVSKDPAFLKIKNVRSVITRKALHCWTFRAALPAATGPQLALDLTASNLRRSGRSSGEQPL